MSIQSAPGEGRQSGPALAYNLAGIAVLVLLLAVGAAYLIDEMSRAARTPVPAIEDGDPIAQTISGHELTIPTAWFRYGEQIRNGFTNQIDLRVMFAPEGSDIAIPVDVTLLPRSRARTSSSLLDGVYLHQFVNETLDGVPGLVGKPMLASNGYSGESVWYDAISPNPFVAKCLEAVEADGTSQCVRTVYLPSGIAAIYAFDATVLQSWRQFDTEMERWLTSIGAW
ncbi:hypothetical protein [Devosia sp. SL43]|uniref:hypothetical protein n=1 Tax=Devosia sp. SL43 TaxID=2806348 RepID=UPI001F3C63EF|nr:hypothetical protein [Devosia sp. SL43]UJW86454.1 hypothetical protein IM737_04085 [Devosia sp. SL43]